MWQSWDKRLKKPLYTLSTMNNIFHDSKSNSSRIICRGHISHHGRWRWCWICLHNSSNIVGDTHAHYTWPPKSYGCNLHMMHCSSQHCWELLHPFAHHCQQGHGKSQHCEPNNVGSCCVLLHVVPFLSPSRALNALARAQIPLSPSPFNAGHAGYGLV